METIKTVNRGTREEIKIDRQSYSDGSFGYRARAYYPDGSGSFETEWFDSEDAAFDAVDAEIAKAE